VCLNLHSGLCPTDNNTYDLSADRDFFDLVDLSHVNEFCQGDLDFANRNGTNMYRGWIESNCSDFFAPMYRARRPERDVLALSFVRWSCPTTLQVRTGPLLVSSDDFVLSSVLFNFRVFPIFVCFVFFGTGHGSSE
jgi:hypothetical protein